MNDIKIIPNDGDHNEGPGSAVIIVYGFMGIWGMILGMFIGWLIWG